VSQEHPGPSKHVLSTGRMPVPLLIHVLGTELHRGGGSLFHGNTRGAEGIVPDRKYCPCPEQSLRLNAGRSQV
jgi:hypothetical protein